MPESEDKATLDELMRRTDRLELKISQLHSMVRAINIRLPPMPSPARLNFEPAFTQEYQGEGIIEGDK